MGKYSKAIFGDNLLGDYIISSEDSEFDEDELNIECSDYQVDEGYDEYIFEKSKQTLYELFVGVFFCMFVEIFLCFYVVKVESITRIIAGSILGTLGAMCFLVSLYKSLDIALTMDEEGAVKYSRKKSIFRTLGVAALMFFSVFIAKYVSVVAVFLGVMSVKFSAYLSPLTHKLFTICNNYKGR